MLVSWQPIVRHCAIVGSLLLSCNRLCGGVLALYRLQAVVHAGCARLQLCALCVVPLLLVHKQQLCRTSWSARPHVLLGGLEAAQHAAHLVLDDSDAHAVILSQDVVEQGGLARTKESRNHLCRCIADRIMRCSNKRSSQER